VELVTYRTRACGMQRRVGRRHGVAVAEGEPRREGRRPREDSAHRRAVEVVDEVGQPGALGVYGPAGAREVPDLFAHGLIGRQLTGELLREPTGQHDRPGAVRQ
jgi:hypothetical protein